jgi:nucleoside-diphosphate-sugar epimerase
MARYLDPAAGEGLSVTTIAAPKVLITGGTGFVGGGTLAQLLLIPGAPKPLILVRAKDDAEGLARITQSVSRFIPLKAAQTFLSQDQILVGGLEDFARLEVDPRLSSVTHVIHAAAITSFGKHPKIWEINVNASLAFLDAVVRNAPLSRFVYVGSSWCVGLNAPKIVPEDGRSQYGGHAVPYTESKAEFERRARLSYPALQFVTARPSIVVGHTKLGTLPSGSIYWVFRAANLIGGFTCADSDRMDVVPVDWVADAITRLAFKPRLKYDTYHLSAGTHLASTAEEIHAAISSGRGSGMNASFEQMTASQLSQRVRDLQKLFGSAQPRLLMRALSVYAHFAESGILFDNANTLAEGIAAPRSFHEYASTCALTAEQTDIGQQMEEDFKV